MVLASIASYTCEADYRLCKDTQSLILGREIPSRAVEDASYGIRNPGLPR